MDAFSSSLGTDNLGTFESLDGKNKVFVIIVVVFLILLILMNVVQYFFNISITSYVQGLFTPKTTLSIVVDKNSTKNSNKPEPAPVPEIKFKKQVFNVPGNYYTYDNAKALCTAYGSDLATYDQIEKAYNSGAEWCNYGWSANQLALFPTQAKTYNKLQGIDGHENDCGRPGINGGYIANKDIQFGANCYGHKPKITQEEEGLMKTISPYPTTAQDVAFQKQVDVFKTKLEQILVSPFNHNSWGSF
jgi:hypothetical protein